MGNVQTAIGYVRVSTDEQKLGPDAQRDAIEAWAMREAISMVAWHFDVGVSGATPIDERDGLMAALASIRSCRAGLLVVAKRDRIARDVVIAAMVERAALEIGAKLVSADGAGNGDSPADAFMRTVIDGAAAYERALIKARTRAALAAKKARGERVGSLPFGFKLADDGKHIQSDEREQHIITRARELRGSGATLNRIVRELAAQGLTSPRSGKPLQLTQVVRILAATGEVAR